MRDISKKKLINTSIIITTFNREKNIFKLINLIYKQVSISKEKIEIIICDSNSKKKLSLLNYLSQFSSLRIIYYNCRINHQAFKRNFGIKNSNGKYKILIDDDCFPERNFLHNFLKTLKLNRKKTIYCGLVKYENFNENRNLIKYRQSRVYSPLMHKSLPYKNFLSMNMAFNNDSVCKNTNFFDNRFRNYGFEDYEFAYRFYKNFYKIIQLNSLVIHKDNRSFKEFLKKYNFLARYGINDILKINLNAAKKLVYYKIESNFLVKTFLKIPYIIFLLSIIENTICFFEKKNLVYLKFLYEIGIFVAYLKGIALRSCNNKFLSSNQSSWYR